MAADTARVFLQKTIDGSISKVIRTKKHLAPATTATGSEAEWEKRLKSVLSANHPFGIDALV